MELKGYQQTNLDALDRFLSCVDKQKNIANGFFEFWQTNNPPITPFPGTVIEPYKNNVVGAPHICHKVPTGGGKTFMAASALKVAMNHLNPEYQVVVWLVPSNAILEQTLRNLRDKQHPYRQRIDSDFGNRVEVFDKQQALTGHGFSLTTVTENLCILVMSFDSFRATNKEGRKVYQENGYLQSFAPLVSKLDDGDDEVQLMKVLQAVHPLVIVDESHNATSELSVQMLNDLKPSLVIDLTATPRENSNIICFTDALELKRNNMVKLPVIVYNHTKKTQVFDSALHLQRQLENTAKEEAKKNKIANYIRPIVLFQAESNIANGEERDTFEKVKEHLLKLGIPEEQIKIKTATIDELKDIDLMSKDCKVRYIITVNALKEGWDCPFAYILASLADKSSSVDVEQIVGRVLRQPYARRCENDILNLSYVLTASSKFQETLESVVDGLYKAGFSSMDYRAVDANEPQEQPKVEIEPTPMDLFPECQLTQAPEIEYEDEINDDEITFIASDDSIDDIDSETSTIDTEERDIETNANASLDSKTPESVTNILDNAQKEAKDMEKQITTIEDNHVVPELAPSVKTSNIKTIFAESAAQVQLPMFFVKNDSPQGCLFEREEYVKLIPEHLLKDFKLLSQPADITFAAADTNMYRVDIDSQSDEHTPVYQKVQGNTYKFIVDKIRSLETRDVKISQCSQKVAEIMGRMIPLKQKDIQEYIKRILYSLNDLELDSFLIHLEEYTQLIKDKILSLETEYKKKVFSNMIDTNKITSRDAYAIPKQITLKVPFGSIPKMLHSNEESVNGFEKDVINEVANLENVEWWTRNVEKKDFYINGFINHYPDFIIKTNKGNIVLLETKGDHLDAADKIKLGGYWSNMAGSKFKYFLVYNTREVENAYTKSAFIDILKDL